ncbi:hypothetical protein [Fructobacillus americanaquae]|uniref:Glycosyltransferase RgtA/B/C/D-like domain-containing protein n=1 Tax=Fructobacillus americanaquae TaxID=2940302 RepID=A0ABY5C1E9_9LACO|nr:hypothetical protein [Fructobacillus americanaquae]USS91904.1 hypothetical protein M3M36_06225 [Fructobacillus americanaquae]
MQQEENEVKLRLSNIFYYIGICVLAIIFLVALVMDPLPIKIAGISQNLGFSFRLLSLCTLLIWLVIVKKQQLRFQTSWYWLIIVGIICLQLFFVLNFFRPVYTDTSYIVDMAASLSHGSHDWPFYFITYPNNYNITVVWAIIFKVLSLVGINSVQLAYPWIQLIALDFSILMFFWAIKIWSKSYAKWLLLLALAYLPIFMYTIFPYNDIFSVSLLFLSIGFFVRYLLAHSLKQQFVYGLLLAFAMAAAVTIRQNTIVILIALLITISILKSISIKQKGILIGVVVLSTLLFNFAFKTTQKHFNYHPQKQLVTPAIRYINMSWNPATSGEIDGNDAWRYANLDKSKRSELLTDELKSRLKQLGPVGIIKHVIKKTAFMFSIGFPKQDMDGLSSHSTSISTTTLFTFLSNFFQPIYLSYLLLALLGVTFKVKNYDGIEKALSLFSSLSITGIFTFQILLWEVRDRYVLPMLPFLIVLTALFFKGQGRKKSDGQTFFQKLTAMIEKRKSELIVSAIGILVLLAFGLSYQQQNHQKKGIIEQTNVQYSSGYWRYAEGNQSSRLLQPATTYQTATFQLKHDANDLTLNTNDLDQGAIDQLKVFLVNQSNGKQHKIQLTATQTHYPVSLTEGAYRFVVKNIGQTDIRSALLVSQLSNQIQGPAVFANHHQLDKERLYFTLSEVQKQPLFAKDALRWLYAIYAIIALIALVIFWKILITNHHLENKDLEQI